MQNDQYDISLTELLGERREPPGEGDAMFTVKEIASTNTMLRGTRRMLNDRIGEEVAKPLTDILAWAKSRQRPTRQPEGGGDRGDGYREIKVTLQGPGRLLATRR